MEPDLEFMTLHSLQVLNNSLLKMRAEAIVKLHALQKTNHDLITENTRLRQHAREAFKHQQEKLPVNNAHSEVARLPERQPPVRQAVRRDERGLISVNLQLGHDFTAIWETRIALTPAEMKEYFQSEDIDLQYTMIVIETKNGIVENASTIVTKKSKVTLRKLQNDMLYHITVHCTVPQGKRRLTSDKKFIYHQMNATYRQSQKEQEVQQPGAESPISVNQKKYTLNVQIGEEDYITFTFNEGDSVSEKAREFMDKHKLKPILLDGLVRAMQDLMESKVTIKSVDTADLL
ncbi:hypothetical protein BgAZ_301120 [Babesia gibsoni]|uniref:Uncharacterized protein n=1 Tax=Babesia gibsoni TaxID=33632 RepID=A0AAD8PDC3_BABGI|nr:hypothetical protein BgAZ_301120 [Babesia gibsoni]